MSQVSKVLRRGADGFFHFCPACQCMHILPDGKNSPGGGWTFSGDVNRPTFTPSFKHGGLRMETKDGNWTGDYVLDAQGRPADGTCHYIITDGQIRFCSDSWHGRTDTVDMPEIPAGVQS